MGTSSAASSSCSLAIRPDPPEAQAILRHEDEAGQDHRDERDACSTIAAATAASSGAPKNVVTPMR